MADRLTQLQDCLDQLITQMYTCLTYIETHHSYAPIPGQPSQDPHNNENERDRAADAADAPAQANGPTSTALTASTPNPSSANPAAPGAEDADPGERRAEPVSGAPLPAPPETFAATLRELAQDLVLKEQQIEYLVGVLPGIGTSEREQVARMAALEAELRAVEEERREAGRERMGLLGRVEGVLGAVKGL